MRKRMIKLISTAVVVSLSITVCSGIAMAAELNRNETVYVKLDHTGKPSSVNSVNWVNVKGQTDFSEKTALKNITIIPDSLKPLMEGDIFKLKLSGKEENIFYSGVADKQLPMQVSIKYLVNGEEIDATKIGGKSGDVEIRIHLKNTTGQDEQLGYDLFKAGRSNFSKTTYIPLMANISLELPLDTFSNISAPDAAQVVVGKTMKIEWIKFPYPEVDLVAKAKTNNFELNPITINLIPQMPPLPEIELEPKLTEMYDGVGEMDKNLGLLCDGSATVKSGISNLNSGLTKFSQGLVQVAGGGTQLATGIPVLSEGVNKLSSATDLLLMAQDGQIKMVQNVTAVNDQLEKAIAALAKTPGFEKQAAQLLAGIQQQKAMLTLLEKGGKLPDGTTFPGLSVTKGGLQQSKAGFTSLKAGVDKLGTGATALNTGLSQLSSNVPQLTNGAGLLEEGTTKLENGIRDFRSIAIVKLQSGISDQINEVRQGQAEKNRIQQRVNSYTTFTGSEDMKNSGTEFLLQTDSIKSNIQGDVANTAVNEENGSDSNADTSNTSSEKNIFQRIADFFKDIF